MKIAIVSDHAGVELKQQVAQFLKNSTHTVLDLGTNGNEAVDYPDYAVLLCNAVLSGKANRGIMLCGSGIGSSIACNKISGIRAALCHDTYSAHQSREHNDCNVLCMGARVLGRELALDIVKTWLNASFLKEERYVRRLKKIADLEKRK
ncbi:MAG: ribose 5-phosphate isomerase B [Elusimicrobia bacterium]|nr:ribose 5-phosphate isomerase B [Elusimicrobiota bacterium]